jgi:hypothetical protein
MISNKYIFFFPYFSLDKRNIHLDEWSYHKYVHKMLKYKRDYFSEAQRFPTKTASLVVREGIPVTAITYHWVFACLSVGSDHDE